MTDQQEQADIVFDLGQKYSSEEDRVFLTGVQALIRVIFDQMRADRRSGARTAAFVSGYPGSPLGGFDKELAGTGKLREKFHVVHRPGHNEDLAATAVAGSQVAPTLGSAKFDGVLGVWYGKAPGLDRSIDAIRHAQYLGTSPLGGVLALVGDDPASKSSSIPSGSEHTIRGIGLPILEPGNLQDVIELGLHGVALSRLSGLWSAVRITTTVADSVGTARVWPGQVDPVLPRLEWRGTPYVPGLTPNVTGQFAIDTEVELLDIRTRVATAYGTANGLNRVVVETGDDWIGFVSRGSTYFELRAALQLLGLDDGALKRFGIRLMQVRMPDPVDPAVLRSFARGLREIVVIEEKRSFLEGTIREALYGLANAPLIVGKRDETGETVFPTYGTLDAEKVAAVVARRLTQRIDASHLRPLRAPRRLLPVADATRAAYLCSGCPHNVSLRVPEGTLLGGGIGCHALGARMDPAMFGEVAVKTHMGGEGAGWIGIEPFVGDDHFTQNIGDGTFFHSGQLAVQAAIAAGSNITFKLLYNGAIAMTGGQSTSSSNAIPVPDVAEVLLRQGVKRVLVTTDDPDRYKHVRLPKGVEAWDRSRLMEAQNVLRSVPGVTVLIHDQQCAAEKRRSRKRGLVPDPPQRIMINERVCEGCGDCGVKSNCLSVEPVETEFGRKTQINQNSCNKDYTCVGGECPSFLTVVPAKTPKKKRGRDGTPPIDSASLPEPVLTVPTDEFVVRMPGIGGTGVVTVNQVLGTAAVLDGRHVWGLDQTGLSQKAGPVVSDIRISKQPLEGSNHPASGSVDLYLVFDLIVGVAPANLEGLDPERTVAVISTSRTPSGDMVSHVDRSYPEASAMDEAVAATVRSGLTQRVDAQGDTAALFGDSATANIYLLGAAYQTGAIALSAESIERAITLNGVAVELNTHAFRWGRLAVADPERVAAAVRRRGPVPAEAAPDHPAVASLVERVADGGDLAAAVRTRVADLIDYQDVRYATRFVDLLATVREAEQRIDPDATALTYSVARNLHKLMAYKDEYEVARLQLLGAEQARVADAFGDDAKVSWNLQPPMLKRWLGDRKVQLGPWFTPVMKALRAGKRLRGTRADVFGRTGIRRMERALVTEYEQLVAAIVGNLSAESLTAAVSTAGLPDMVRGYESVKIANVERYRSAVAIARRDL